MSLLSQSQIDQLTSFTEENMLDVMDVTRPTRTSDGSGGSTLTYPVVQSQAPCRLTMISERGTERLTESVVASQMKVFSAYTLECPKDTVLKGQDRVIISGRTFEVKGFVNVGFYAVRQKVVVEEIL